MFKYDEFTNKIELTKGDNAEIIITLYDRDGKQRQIFSDDIITLTVRKDENSEIAFTKTAVNGVFSIVPNDTKALAAGLYIYDVQINTFTGKTYTVIPLSYIELLQEVSQ